MDHLRQPTIIQLHAIQVCNGKRIASHNASTNQERCLMDTFPSPPRWFLDVPESSSLETLPQCDSSTQTLVPCRGGNIRHLLLVHRQGL